MSAEAPTETESRLRTRFGFRGKRVFLVIFVVVAIVDLLSKSLVFAWVDASGTPSDLHHGEKAIEIVPGLFYLARVWNPGGIWGIAQEGLASKLLVAFRFVAVPGLFVMAGLTAASDRRILVALGLFCAGALGNLCDNLVYPSLGVRDFLDVFLPIGANGYHYPTFNVADAGIVTAAGLLILDLFLPRRAAASPSP